MTISIHQPSVYPWLPYLEKARHCDLFVILDTVQYEKNYFGNRNKIRYQGNDRWLTIPMKAGSSKRTYSETYPADPTWVQKNLNLLQQAYGKAPHFDHYYPGLKETLLTLPSGGSLADIADHTLSFFTQAFGITTPTTRTSLGEFLGKGSDLVLNICKAFEADTYYSGPCGRDYLNEIDFKQAGIEVVYQNYTPPNPYAALHQLFTTGPEL